ncbi:hypothetical protein GCM10022211_14380 [Sphingomonas humi]|uniref:HPt domain-containing protein n=2 Tax=Sphingomonas humi TaxID=335630 RepID=A0ABP7RY20_9SPHN
MRNETGLQFRLAQAKEACIERMQGTADWLIATDPSDRDALRQCGHRLVGTLGSFGFGDAARKASALERACDAEPEQVRLAALTLAETLRTLPR